MEKVAVISVDSFSAKLSIVKVEDGNYFAITDSEKEELKLLLEPDSDMFWKKSQIDATIKALKNLRKICELYEVDKVIAVASFNENQKPKNMHSFFDEVFNLCGFRFEILSDEEKNNYIYNAIINSFDVPKGVICHIDQENTRIVVYNRRSILNQTTLGFGPLTLADAYDLNEQNKEADLKEMANKVREELAKVVWIEPMEEDYGLIGSGALFEDIATMAKRYRKYPLDLVNNYNLDVADIASVYEQIKSASIDKTKKIKGVGEKRADVFVASMIIAMCVSEKFAGDKFVISNRGVEHGILFKEEISACQEKPISDVLGYSIIGQSHFFDAPNDKHNEQVYNLSLLLFKQLRVLHKLPRGYTRILRLAAYMHDCGERIGHIGHAKNGFSVLLGSEIYGVTHRELVLAGFALALHTGDSIPMSEFIKYRDLITEEDINAVKKLGIIIRLAESFDRVKNNVIVDINCDVLGDSVIMKTIAVGDNAYEIEKASECSKDFEKNFGKKIEIL
ncbi:MAG: hypothetical protein IJS68_02215 [Clostridia bacterium]|nr:hypothetical protein [Clostridia bacterium]